MDTVRENIAHIAAWIPPVLILLALSAAAGMLALRRARKLGTAAPGGLQRLGTHLSRFTLVGSIIGLAVAFWPMSPLFRSAILLETGTGETVREIPFVQVSDLRRRTLGELRGRVVLVNLWATWCPPCRTELPALDSLAVSYRDSGLTVVTLSDEPPAQLKDLLEKLSPHTLNGSVASFEWLPVRDFRPFTILIDREGILRDFVFGVQEYAAFETMVLAELRRP